MERLTDGLKKILLAGIGTVAVTAEKSKEVLDEMVKRGELTVEQGKVLNQELKHNIKDTVKKNVNVSVKPQSPEELEELLDKMTPEQIQALKSKLAQMDEADVDQEADESVFEDEDIVTDTSADGKSASGGESQTVDIKIEAEDDKEESVSMDSRLKEMTAVLKKYKLTHGLTPEKFRLILQELGPTYIKLGQIMSLHSDILPKEYCEELMKVCSDVEPMPFEQVEAVIDA